jgi:DnaJ-domain-containing protein 1
MCFACDKYLHVWENMVAIRKTIQAIRGIERWGASDMMERAFRGFVALPATEAWHDVLQVRTDSSEHEVLANYRRLRSEHHPDRGGDAQRFNSISRAWEQYRAARGL